MSGLDDLQQPANLWLADVVDNINRLQNIGEEPSIDICIFGVMFELRLKDIDEPAFKPPSDV